MVTFAPGRVATDQVLFAREGRLGRIRLNRPRAINALTEEMCLAIGAELNAWANDDSVAAIAIDGAGERGLCSGGDIVAVRALALENDPSATDFWETEYALNALIHDYAKPIIAVQDGIVMGGGIGISAYALLRLATETSRVAMPETIIGFYPDVGALKLLANAPGELGTHLAMSGASITGADAVAVGFSDTLVSSADIPAILAGVAETGEVDRSVGVAAPYSPLLSQRSWIDECYVGDDPVAIVSRLEAHAAPEAQEAAAAIRARSPLSVAVTLEGLRRARDLPSVIETLILDGIVAPNFLALPSDFNEGIRARLVDKDNAPVWRHASLADVTRAEVEAFFIQH
ncbi:3-hydroxyisobutyryl-CoA hydrolase [Kribbia dieselivorans]|uniref:3-hydroxyisobutyryl-CoA hydrolase n=1 Tax=Kribbia dieselivorans TaxID=331526 RepID=UPI0008387704|nr:3-hydroxyisobutyryl-CoA hydrolase [Kribbia dieselivorans]